MLIGPGGAGKGTVAAELVAHDPTLWLSRSWTTRAARARASASGTPTSSSTATTFEEAVAQGGFFEWAEFLDYLMGTPIPDPPPGADVLLEIDVQGAEQVLAQRPDATVILLLPPSPRCRPSAWPLGATTRSTSAGGSSWGGRRWSAEPKSQLTRWSTTTCRRPWPT